MRVQAVCSSILAVSLASGAAQAQQTDRSQTPNPEGAGIARSLEEQIGRGRGNESRPDSSWFVIKRDPFRAIARGQRLFQRKFTQAQGLGPRVGDGLTDDPSHLAPRAGLSDSCAGCHGRPHGAAGFGGVVFTRPDSRDAPHLFGLGLQEMLADEITAELRQQRRHALQQAKKRGRRVRVQLEAKGIEYGYLTARPNGEVDTSELEGVDADLRVKPFFAEGSMFSIRQFVVGAFANEMGLQSADPDLLYASRGREVLTPAGMILDGRLDRIDAPPLSSTREDGDGDGVVNELPASLIDFMEFYLLNYFKPASGRQTIETVLGRIGFNQMGCADCHRPNLLVEKDRRVADVETFFDPERGIFNRLFAEATPLFVESDDGTGHPTLKLPAEESFLVRDIFTDFRRHDLGPAFHERRFDGGLDTEFMTEPLWGVGSSAPYGHDGRSINLTEVILRHGGAAQEARDAFARAPWWWQAWVVEFLESLVLFGPPDTASNLDPGDPSNPAFPQRGHGSVDLAVLFNNPGEAE
jgi:hypothetical protein